MQAAGQPLSPCYLRSCNWSPETAAQSDVIHNLIGEDDCDLERYKRLTKVFTLYHPKNADNRGWNTLCWASWLGKVDIVLHVLETHKANNCLISRIGTAFGWTPLFCACLSNNFVAAQEIATLLITNEVDVNTTTPMRPHKVTLTNFYGFSYDYIIPTTTTPLWAANNISKNYLLAKRLREAGGVEGQNCLK